MLRSTVLLRTLVWLGLLTGCTLVACRPILEAPSPSAAAPTVTVPFELPITIALSGSLDDPTLRVLDEQIAAFETTNPDIRVEVVKPPKSAGTGPEAFVAELQQGDTSRDILLLNPAWLARLAATGGLRPLDQYIRAYHLDTTSFFPAIIQANTLDGQIFALPWTIDGGLWYYRRDLLEKYGHQPPSTWDDLPFLIRNLRAQEEQTAGYVWQADGYETLTCNVLEFIWAYGGEVIDQGNIVFDSPATRTALRQMAELIASGVSPGEVTTYQETATLALFQSGKAAVMRNWSYAWDRLNRPDSPVAGRVGMAPLPASCLGGSSLALSAFSQHPEQAFRFVAFLVSYESQAQLALQETQPPALESVYADPLLLEADPSLQALHAALSATRPRPQTSLYPELSAIIYTEVHKLLTQQQGVETTAETIQRRLSELLEPQIP